MKKAILLANDTMFAYNLRRELLERLLKEGYDVTVIAQPLVHQEKLQFMGCRETVPTAL